MSSKGPSGGESSREFVDQFKKLVAANVAGNLQLVTRFNDFLRDAATVVKTGRAGEPADAGALLSRWIDFNLASYSAVSTHGLALLNGLLAAAESSLIPKAPSAPQAGPTQEPRVELRLSGRQGERVTSAFLVENHYDRPLDVAFESGDLVSATGESLPSSLVGFEPPRLAIAPRGEAVVQAAVKITRKFIVGKTYTTTIRMLGFHAREVGLWVTVLPPAEAPKVSGPSPKRTRLAKKRRVRSSG